MHIATVVRTRFPDQWIVIITGPNVEYVRTFKSPDICDAVTMAFETFGLEVRQ